MIQIVYFIKQISNSTYKNASIVHNPNYEQCLDC